MGILKTAATVAVASSVHGRIQRRQQQRWAAQDDPAMTAAAPVPQQASAAVPQQAPAAAAPGATGDRLAQLSQLGDLKNAGVLTQAEFEREKARILGQ